MTSPLERTVPEDGTGERLDAWLAHAEPHHSRARWQQLIRQERVQVDGVPRKPNHRLAAGERVTWEEPPPEPPALTPEARDLDILYEDADILVLNKPPDLVVHPAPGHRGGTLVHALLYHCKDLAGIGGETRPGIVHRLDRDTSGVMVVAKSEAAMRGLVGQFREHEVQKTYLALVRGLPEPESGTIRTLIGRHPVHRQKMTTNPPRGRHAVTHYETVERFAHTALLSVRIETGRTHQIRVHLAHIGHPVIGDKLYSRGRTGDLPAPVARQMLHAACLAFIHPTSGKELEFEAPTPADMRALIQALREEGGEHAE